MPKTTFCNHERPETEYFHFHNTFSHIYIFEKTEKAGKVALLNILSKTWTEFPVGPYESM